MRRYLLPALALLAAVVVLSWGAAGCPVPLALAQEPAASSPVAPLPVLPPGADPELTLFFQLAELQRQQLLLGQHQQVPGTGVASTAGASVVGSLVTTLGVLLGLMRYGDRLGLGSAPAPAPVSALKDPDTAAALARIEARLEHDHGELERVRDKLHTLVNAVTPLPPQIELLCERIESLEGARPRGV